MNNTFDYESDDFGTASDFEDREPDWISDDGLGGEPGWQDDDSYDPSSSDEPFYESETATDWTDDGSLESTPVYPDSSLLDESETATNWTHGDSYAPSPSSSSVALCRGVSNVKWKIAAAATAVLLLGAVFAYTSPIVGPLDEQDLIGTWDAHGTYYTTLPWSSTSVMIDGSLEIRFNEAQALTVNVRPDRVEVVGGPTIAVPDVFPEFKGTWSMNSGKLAFRIDESDSVRLDFLIAILESGYDVQVMNQRFELEIESFDDRTLTLEKGIVLERF